MAVANAGVKVAPVSTSFESVAMADAALVAVIVYVFVVTPSWAVDMIFIVLLPTASAIGPDAAPEATAMPFTVSVAVASCSVAVTVTLLVVFGIEVA